MPLPDKPTATLIRLNPHLFGGVPPASVSVAVAPPLPSAPSERKRLKQKSGDGLNKTERAFFNHLKSGQPVEGLVHNPLNIRPHGLTLVLANGTKYTPDFFYGDPENLRAYEVKGAHAWDDAIVKVKIAASQNPWLTIYVASGDSKGSPWQIQKLIP